MLGLCTDCGTMINYEKARYCDKCKEKYFKKVKDYVDRNKNTSAKKVAEKLNISKALVDEFIKDGRIEEVVKLESSNKTNSGEQDKRKALEDMKRLMMLEKQNRENQINQSFNYTGEFHLKRKK